MLSIATGHDVGYLTGAVAGGREGYYSGAVDAGEPAGLWYGAGAAKLGLDGEVNPELMEAVYSRLLDPRDPAAHRRDSWGQARALAPGHRVYKSAEQIYAGLLEDNPHADPERRAQLRAVAERSARQAVSFIDVTFSAPKSVTVLGVAFERAANDARTAGDQTGAAAWSAHAHAVEDAVLAGSRAVLDFLQDQGGYSRVGHHGGGAGRWVDAHEFVVAQFVQHDSRDRDPQLHVHNAILNRVRCADGTWRSLDSRAIHTLRAAAGAIGERVMEAHLTHTLGAQFETRPDGRAREVIGIPGELIEVFSSRRRAVTAKTAEHLATFAARYGRAPSPAERYYITAQATLATRAGKSHAGETRDQQLDRWSAQCRDQINGGLARVGTDVLHRAQQPAPPAHWSPRDVTARALATVADSVQAWSRSALTRAISDALPGNLRITPEQVRPLLEGLTDLALAQAIPVTVTGDTTNMPAAELLANGSSPYTAPTGALFTVAGQLRAEHALRAAAITRGAASFTSEQTEQIIAQYAAAGRVLGADQAAAIRGVLTSGAQVEVLAAAPGTGKSFVVGVLAEAWVQDNEGGVGRRVFGLAPSQVAANVLADEGISAAANTTAWLGAQNRLDRASPDGVDRFGDQTWRLSRDDLVVVDEANMTATDQLAEIQCRCAAAGAKLLLVGDPAQLAAVGPGGALADIAERGISYQLCDVRRFTHPWERRACIALREGDPAVLGDYAKHGRLHAGGAAAQAERAGARAWLADTLGGREALLLVGDNATAARISADLRAQLVALGKVEETGVALGRADWHGVIAGVGDLVQARRNARELTGHAGNTTFPVNRATYRVTALRADGGLTVAPILTHPDGTDAAGEVLGAPLALPASYVTHDLTLAYASTVHAAEGRTVDTAHTVLAPGTDHSALLVSMTRGRESNTAWVVTQSLAPDAAAGQTHIVVPRTPRAVLADVLENVGQERSALAQVEQAALDAGSTATHIDQLIDVIARHTTPGHTAAILDRLAAHGVLTPAQREALVADEAYGSLQRLLRTAELAGHHPDQILTTAITSRSLNDARSPAQVLHHRIAITLHGHLTPRLESAADLIPTEVPPQWKQWLADRAEAADLRRHELGAQLAESPPTWALGALGAVPADGLARHEWEHRVGWAGAYRELVAHTDQADPLGPAPAPGLAEKTALFRTAHQALDLIDVGAQEAELSDGRLRARVHALTREETWAPHYVADQLAATHQQAAQAHTDATIWAARADTTPDPAQAQRLRADAATAAQQAERLAERAASLEAVDEARAEWYTHTAITRDNALRARAELTNRGINPDDPDERVTATEWLAAHHAEQTETDATREVRDEHDLHDPQMHDPRRHDQQLHDPDRRELGRGTDDPTPTISTETVAPDIRDLSTTPPTETADPGKRHHVPTADETAQVVSRAQAALAEIATRTNTDTAHTATGVDECTRQDQLAQWNHDNQTTPAAGAEREDGLALER